ncbi:MAG: molybdopterin-binding protein [Myxococcota bacterium]
MSTAGLVIIGDEVLSGKVEDKNTPYLLPELRRQGVDVGRVHVIPDDVDLIAEEVRSFSARFDYVLTSGGVGPTHDDVTMEGVARAFGVRLTTHEAMKALLLQALRDTEANASQLKMCELPEGAQLIQSGDLWFPLVYIRNVYIFPGIPRLLQAKFESARDCFKGSPFYLRRIFMSCIESDIAQDLHDLLKEFPELQLGSYPRTTEGDYRTMVTLESRDVAYVNKAVDSLIDRLPAASLLRVE